MLFEHGICLGDSLTSGARSPYGVAEALAHQLNRATNKRWLFRNEAVNGETVLQQLRRLDQKPWMWKDAAFGTLLIGTNDAKSTVDTLPGVFQILFGQILDRLLVARVFVVPALLPDLQAGASLASPYDSRCAERIKNFNAGIRAECASRGLESAVCDLAGLPPECYADGVHFSTAGVEEVARRLAAKITGR
jgi:lysophospholipase L1-like esterase